MQSLYRTLFSTLVCLLGIAQITSAQLTVPQVSPRSRLMQTIGLTEVTIDYSRPNVVSNEKDRTGEIWGKLVPWETTPNPMTGRTYPWRAGANENTVITFSTAVSIEGQPLPAGSYSFHIIPHENGEATLIFNKDYHQWGSFVYDEKDDALRVKITTTEGPQVNLLAYSFPEVDKEAAVCELAWEKKRFPFSIAVNTHEVTLQHMKEELGQSKGFIWQTFNTAAKYCVDNDVDLKQGMEWIDRGILYFGGNFPMYSTKAELLEKMDQEEEAKSFKAKAMAVGTVREVFGYGNTLVNSGKIDEGLEVMKKNYDKFYALDYQDAADECIVNLGLAMAYSKKKDMKMAMKYGNVGVEKAPPSLKAAAEGFVAQLQQTDN
ncbi:MAG: DUF2911 domain-containing protein [Lewinella sp.]|nr:DUF2911 domain-containing protein [Lewinella sp.]